jgi:hypothetical protein
MGFSESEADTLTAYQRFSSGEMGTLEKESFKIMNSSLAEKAEMIANTRGIEELTPQRDPTTGNFIIPELPKFNDLAQKYSSVQPATLKEIATPSYRLSLRDDFKIFLTENPDVKELAASVNLNTTSFSAAVSDPKISDLLDNAHRIFRDIFTSRAEIEAEFYSYLVSPQFSIDFKK